MMMMTGERKCVLLRAFSLLLLLYFCIQDVYNTEERRRLPLLGLSVDNDWHSLTDHGGDDGDVAALW